jgi:hypothetical protein
MYYILWIILIVLIIIFVYASKKNIKEKFQYIMTKDLKPKAVEFIPTDKSNILLDVDVLNYDECFELCRTTPDCDGFNYFQETCSLYGNLKDFKPSIAYYAYW